MINPYFLIIDGKLTQGIYNVTLSSATNTPGNDSKIAIKTLTNNYIAQCFVFVDIDGNIIN